MAKDYARLIGECACFHQRIFHARSLPHGLQGFTDHGRAHAFGAQVTQLLDLQEIKEGIGIRRWQQSGFFPASQLPRCNAKDPQDVRSIVSFHSWPFGSTRSFLQSYRILCETRSENSKGELALNCGKLTLLVNFGSV